MKQSQINSYLIRFQLSELRYYSVFYLAKALLTFRIAMSILTSGYTSDTNALRSIQKLPGQLR
ncbi:hypothetical protein PMIT1313_00118 [Prochlorococcus marinus str. MIT 1313]|nr:hypothetical protein PMIT1313_00118 [Prochlorococcus marinus str. MIT 1313]KZR74593.1 hypothetical protein PMIT1318_00336 [Prochlorococcus marinus str. MIT 1318]